MQCNMTEGHMHSRCTYIILFGDLVQGLSTLNVGCHMHNPMSHQEMVQVLPMVMPVSEGHVSRRSIGFETCL